MRATRLTILLTTVIMLNAGGCQSLELLAMKKPTANLTGLQFGDVGLKAATLIFDVEIDNPYPFDLPLSNLDYSLTTNDNPFLAGAADVQGSIPAKSAQTVSLPVSVNYLEMFKALKDVRPGSTIPYHAEAGLAVDASKLGRMRLPLTREGQLTLPSTTEEGLKTLLNYLNKPAAQ